jgi:sirohydrochlorin cobaltochelatase
VKIMEDKFEAWTEHNALDAKLRTILPSQYAASYEEVCPVSMGSAPVKFDAQGRVAWDEMWGSFCDLAMAGGPPHRGTLLEPASQHQIEAQPDQHRAVVGEICRGIRMISSVAVEPSQNPGWVRLMCHLPGMTGWLLRAITIENVSAYYCQGDSIELPAGPHYRVEKEIKNVITAVAKTTHYFEGHMSRFHQREIATQFAQTEAAHPLIQAAVAGHGFDEESIRCSASLASHRLAGVTALPMEKDGRYKCWIGLECPTVRAAIWMMRAIMASNIVARREGTILYLPINPVTDPQGECVVDSFALVQRLAVAQGAFARR